MDKSKSLCDVIFCIVNVIIINELKAPNNQNISAYDIHITGIAQYNIEDARKYISITHVRNCWCGICIVYGAFLKYASVCVCVSDHIYVDHNLFIYFTWTTLVYFLTTIKCVCVTLTTSN